MCPKIRRRDSWILSRSVAEGSSLRCVCLVGCRLLLRYDREEETSALVPHVLFNFFGRCYSPLTSSSKIDSSSDGAAIRTGGSNASE
jgi:hypothetical protein